MYREPAKATETGVGGGARARWLGHWRSSLPALLVLIVSLAATVLTWQVFKVQTETNAATDFENDMRQIAQTIAIGMQGYEETLHAAAALFATSGVVTRDDWRRFVDGLELSRDHPGIEVLGFAKHVSAQERQHHEREMQAQGVPGYSIWPAERSRRFDRGHLHRASGTEARRLLGFDLMSDAISRRAMEASRAATSVRLSSRGLQTRIATPGISSQRC